VNHHFVVEKFFSEYPDLVAAKINCTNFVLFFGVWWEILFKQYTPTKSGFDLLKRLLVIWKGNSFYHYCDE